ncbi:hypothetical protein [Streptomyces sp. NPDC001274]
MTAGPPRRIAVDPPAPSPPSPVLAHRLTGAPSFGIPPRALRP